jgi:hypothetical protein
VASIDLDYLAERARVGAVLLGAAALSLAAVVFLYPWVRAFLSPDEAVDQGLD